MENKTIQEFKELKQWVLGEKKILINKIETTTYTWVDEVSPEKELETVEPRKALHNVIKNVALMNNASFLETNKSQVLARISDVSGNTLIVTQWYLPIDEFSTLATYISYRDGIDESKFHLISKIS